MIRDAESNDITQIRAVMQSIPGFWDEGWPPDVLERALASADTIALVHQDGETINGFICAHDLSFRAYLSEVVVSPTAQGCGIGSRLLAEVERRLANRGCRVIIADVWRDAEQFYRTRGWSTPSVALVRKRLSSPAPPT